MIRSGKTTTMGTIAVLTSVSSIAKTLAEHGWKAGISMVDWPTNITAVVTGIGLILARDQKVSDEQAGAGIKKGDVPDDYTGSSNDRRGPLRSSGDEIPGIDFEVDEKTGLRKK